MKQRRGGFTLWELVLVLMFLGMTAVLTLPAFTSLGTAEKKEPTDGVLHLLRDARRLAITRGSTVSIVLDPSTARYRIDTTAINGDISPLIEAKLPLELGMILTADSARAHFIFAPTGAAIADTLRVQSRAGRQAIVVDPWDGRADVR